jgi:Xaa-Pro aminopeptidase
MKNVVFFSWILNNKFIKYDSKFRKWYKRDNIMRPTYRIKAILPLFLISIIFLQKFYAQEKSVFEKRREILLSKMNGGIAIIKGANPVNRNGDVEFPFRQNSDFYYLTGFDEPNSALLLLPDENNKFILFVRPKNIMMETWTGNRAGVEGAMKLFGADTAYGINSFEEILLNYLKQRSKIYINISDKELVKQVDSLYKRANGNQDKENVNIHKIISEMRVIKSQEEIELIKKACKITSEAQIEAMKAAKISRKEYELSAIIEYVFKKNAAQCYAFPSIVGSGINSTILHYEAGDKSLENGDIVVIDIGAEYNYYASDITRSIPANGKFTTEQKEIYGIVLEANKEAIQFAKPGAGLNEIQNRGKLFITEGLYKLGLITNKDKAWQTDVWMPHSISHYIGMDVHDVGDAGYFTAKGRTVEEGMVFSIEPGIYINKNTFSHLKDLYGFMVDKKELEDFMDSVKPFVEKFNGIGIRIEDTIVITKDGCEVLSSEAPKEIKEIEEIMKDKNKFN